MSVPASIRREIKERLWAEADRLNWSALSAADKSRYYSMWTETETVGGKLGQYMDPRKVRVYIKDTLLKSYTREASASPARAFRVLGLDEDVVVSTTFIKPHGCLLVDGRQIAWSKASDWKATLMALHERAFMEGQPYAAVLTEAAAKFALASQRAVVESAAERLLIKRLIWLD
ncbi:hypothetical protein [Wenxinia saemankumensis]|uniref:Uncharacterized protein n=1 Tax=Wenxinia saemankumensis TaxID=1447782 RepID=A0A1M6H9H8_9RHOB|nr:hypothetical protein [Wenxinia saemankumensis]SHJ18920.1 hypothetical protein SAMN05444417_3104 [Wenxinia saemankumensis]